MPQKGKWGIIALGLFIVLASSSMQAQINIALTATATHSGGGNPSLGFGPDNYNDGTINPIGCSPTPCGWGWVSSNGWIEYEWTTPQTISAVKFFFDNRPMSSCTFQIWDGTTYQNILSYVRPTSSTDNDSVVLTAPVTTTKLRFNTVAGSNPNHREIQVFQAINAFNDAGISTVVSPNAFCPGTEPVIVRVNNFGKNRIDSVLVNWQLDGVNQTSKWLVATLDTFGGTLPTFNDFFLDSVTFTANISRTIKAWTSLPNNVADTVNFNDTITVTRAPAISGSYTINSNLTTGGSNFANFADFGNFLTTNGICGPVTVDVFNSANPYVGQLKLDNINGTSATNTITINGNGATMSFGGGTSDRGTFVIINTSHITVKNLKILATGTSNSYALELRNNASFLEFDSCEFRADLTSTGSTVAGIVASNSATSPTTAGLAASNVTIKNSVIEGGYYGVVLNGATTAPGLGQNNVVENNIIRDFYLYGMYLRGQENSIFKNNDINRDGRTGTITTFYGIYFINDAPGVQIVGNRIHSPATTNTAATGTAYPIYFTTNNATAANPMIVANNVIYNMNMNGLTYAIYQLTGNFVNFYHNTVMLDNVSATTASAQRALFITSGSGNFEVKNNLFYINHGGTGIKNLIYLSSTAPTFSIDNNQYSIEGNGTKHVGFWSGANQTTFTNWQAANSGTFDQNGVLGDPIFSTTNVFTPQTSIGNDAGANLFATVATDIFGAARDTTPDIGAVEYTPLTCLQPLGFSGTSTSTTITINWTNDPDADSVHIEYGPCGFNQGTGTMVNVSGATFTATNLFPETCYDFYVYTWCNGVAGNGTTLFSFTTLCGPKTLPYSENFDNNPGGTSTLVPNTPNCWTYVNTSASTAVYGYNYTALNPNSTPNHWRMYNGANTTDTLAIVSPQLTGLNQNDKRVRFWIKSNTATPTRMFIGTMANPLQRNTLSILDTFFAPQNYTEFTKVFTTATGYNGTDEYVVFMMGNTATAQSLYLDDIVFESVPNCNPPVALAAGNITSASAAITWGTVNGTCFKLEYGPTGFTVGTGQGTVVQNATSPTTISGLSPNTVYDVYIADCCDTTAWAGPLTFKTNCLTQLSGTYTINKNDSTGGTNFETFADFVGALDNCGVSGPVTVNVVAGSGPYNEQILIEDFLGASAANKVTVNGNGNRLTFASLNSNQRATLTLDNAQHIEFKNLEIEGSGTTNCYAVQFQNGTSNVTFDSCYIFVNTALTTSLLNPLVWNDSPTSPTAAATTTYNNNTIKNCVIEGGYYGFVFNGPTSGTLSTGNVIENNEIRDFYLYGLYSRGQDDALIKGNSINRKNRTTLSTFYGIYMVNAMEDVRIIGNRIHDNSTQQTTSTSTAYPIYATSLTGSATKPILFANNLMYNINSNGLTYGMYILGTSTSWQIYHNSLSLDNTSGTSTSTQRVFFSTASSGSFDIRNNIFDCTFGGTGTKHLVYISNTTPTYTINYNQYNAGGGGAATVNNVGYWGTASFNALANWQTANNNAFEANGVSGNPVFASPLTDNLTPLAPTGNNIAFNLNTVVPNDYFDVARSNTPDIGAIEFTPITADIALVGTNLERGVCFSSADTVQLTIQNVIGSTINFATTPLTAQWSVSGPVNSNGTITVNSGTLAAGASTTVQAFSVNMSQPGLYTLNANILANANNQFAGNDTLDGFVLEVRPIFEADPQVDTVFNATDSVEITVRSPFLAGGDFFITEVCHFKTTAGAPTLGWPTYLLADDYIEITGVPGSDLGGYTLEQWTTTLQSSYTFPVGTVLSPNGTAIIAVGQLGSSVPSPANFYYHGNGTYTGSFGSSGAAGRIIKDGNGNIVDAVGYSGYTFPAAANVAPTDWSNSTAGGVSTSGQRLTGPDQNNGSNWVVTSAAIPQDPNTLNANVPLPNPQGTAGFTWSFNGVVIDTNVTIHVGPYANPGVYQYIASYTNSPCGTLYDTVTIHAIFTVPCLAPSNVNTANLVCDATDITWSSDPNKLSSKIEYGAPGFTPGSGTVVNGVSSPYNLIGLAPGTGYDVYVTDSCAAGSSNAVKLSFTTPTTPLPTLNPTSTITVTFTQADVVFNAGSNANTINWNFGDGNNGTGNNPTHTYAANGTYSVIVTAINGCGTVSDTFDVVIAGINIEETILAKSLNIFPNPNTGAFRISFMVEGVKKTNLQVLNPMGQVVYSYEPGNISGEFKHDIDLSRMAAGVYIVQITTDDGIISRRVTVQK